MKFRSIVRSKPFRYCAWLLSGTAMAVVSANHYFDAKIAPHLKSKASAVEANVTNEQILDVLEPIDKRSADYLAVLKLRQKLHQGAHKR